MTAQPRRTALVTGSARGIGLAIATRLAADGMSVIGVDVNAHDDDAPMVERIQADLATLEGTSDVLERVGAVDVLVNNAALFLDGEFERADVADIDRMYAVNLRAPILLARGLAPRMASRRWGRIINVSSVGVHTGGLSPASALYASTKAGLHTLTRYLARAYGPHGVTANAIAPAWIDTEMGQLSRKAGASVPLEEIPLRRSASPAEVAAAAAFLASDAAGYITGSVIDVNGGWLMR